MKVCAQTEQNSGSAYATDCRAKNRKSDAEQLATGEAADDSGNNQDKNKDNHRFVLTSPRVQSRIGLR